MFNYNQKVYIKDLYGEINECLFLEHWGFDSAYINHNGNSVLVNIDELFLSKNELIEKEINKKMKEIEINDIFVKEWDEKKISLKHEISLLHKKIKEVI